MCSTSGFSMRSRNCRAYADRLSTYRRWPSAYTVSNASELLPEPDTPLTTVKALCGISTSIPLRLWVRAPRIVIWSFASTVGIWLRPPPRRALARLRAQHLQQQQTCADDDAGVR